MNISTGWAISIFTLSIGLAIPVNAKKVDAPSVSVVPSVISVVPLAITERVVETVPKTITFSHGDISWLPELAAQAGWKPKHIARLGQIILRESGGCPNRRGGDRVDENCNVTGIAERNHRSDTGLLQINGVNYDVSRNKWAAVCRAGIACSQKPLLDALTNLRAGYELFRLSGWGPWDPCQWGPAYAHRCVKTNTP